MHGARPSAIDINVIGTKGCHFELEAVFHHEDHPKMRANRIGAWKNFLHNFRLGVGSDIEVLRSFAADDVAHAASGEIRNMAALAQTRGNFAAKLPRVCARAAMLRISPEAACATSSAAKLRRTSISLPTPSRKLCRKFFHAPMRLARILG